MRKYRRPILGVLAALAFASPASAATFGYTEVGPKLDNSVKSNFKRADTFKLNEAGSVSKLDLYAVRGTQWKTGAKQKLKAVIYADSSGKPGALLATGSEVLYEGTTGWLNLPFSSGVHLAKGTYWLGFISGETSGIAAFKYQAVTNIRAKNENSYTSGPTNPFGTYTADSEEMSLYATYQPAPSVEILPPRVVKYEFGEDLSYVAKINPNGASTDFRFHALTREEWEANPASEGGVWNPCLACEREYNETAITGTSFIEKTYPILEGGAGGTFNEYQVVATNEGGTTKSPYEEYKAEGATGKPEVSPAGASAITETTATLKGELNANGTETSSCTFKYGTEEGSLTKSAPCSIQKVAGEQNHLVTGSLTGLTANTTYYFAQEATNSYGTTLVGNNGLSTFKTT